MRDPAAEPPDRDSFATLARPYAIVIHVPYYEDADGAVWLERLWHRDLVEHLRYLPDFILCAPRRPRGSEPDLVRLEAPAGVTLRIVPLPRRETRLRALLGLPGTALAVWRAVGLADVVHTGMGGWPFPIGWIAAPVARLRRRRLVVGVESSWRHGVPGHEGPITRLYNAVADGLARWACRRADVSFYTQAAYREKLHRGGRGAAYVTPAIWINEDEVLDDEAAAAAWARRSEEPVRLLFGGRIIAHKGSEVLLGALRLLEERGVAVRVDVMGLGDRRGAFEDAARVLRRVKLAVHDPVPYGRPFFDVLRRYHAVLVPSLTDEQPRIVFDAAAQGLPVIASDTDGLRPHVRQGETGWLVAAGDAGALAEALERAAASGPELRRLGLAALAACRRATHREMHRVRSWFLHEHLA